MTAASVLPQKPTGGGAFPLAPAGVLVPAACQLRVPAIGFPTVHARARQSEEIS